MEVAPIRHHLRERISARCLICQLAANVRWHMQRDLASLLFKDESTPTANDPMAPAPALCVCRAQGTAPVPSGATRFLVKVASSSIGEWKASDRPALAVALEPANPLQEHAFQLLGINLRLAKTPAA